MKRYLGIDGIQVMWADQLWRLLKAMAAGLVTFFALFGLGCCTGALKAQEPQIGWQLGICVDDQFRLTTCRLIGGPLPDEQLCKGLRDSLKARINAGRVHCTRVLIDAQSDID